MDEALFKEKLAQITRQAREQGLCISTEDVKKTFDEYANDEEKMNNIYAYLKSQKIAVGDEEAVKDYLSMEDRNYLEIYLDEISQIEKKDKEELDNIAASAICQDEEAIGIILSQLLSDVPQLAKMYSGQGVLLQDLIGEGNLALTCALSEIGCLEGEEDAFAEIQGFVGKKMMDAMEALINEEYGEKNTDQEIVDQVNEVADIARKLSEDFRRKVTPQEICEESDLSMEQVLKAISLSAKKIEDIEYGVQE